MTTNKTGPVSLAYYVTSTLKASPSLNDWERMHISLSQWMSEEVEELDRIIAYHEEKEQPKKAYKARIRQQNYVASIEFLTRVFQQLISLHQQVQAKADISSNKYIRLEKHADFLLENWQSSMQEAELMTQIALQAMQGNLPQEDDPLAEIRQLLLRTDPLFRKGVRVLVANGITEL